MTRHVVLAALASSLVAAAGTPAAAQQRDDARPATRWTAAFAIDPFDLDLRTKDPGAEGSFFATLGREWRRGSSQLGLRTQVMLGADLPRGFRFTDQHCAGRCEVGVQHQYAGVLAAATLAWPMMRSVRPYVLAGPALFAERTRTTVERGCVSVDGTCPPSEWDASAGTTTRTAFGAWGGLGIDFSLRGRAVFVEQSVYWLQRSPDRTAAPLSFGVRW